MAASTEWDPDGGGFDVISDRVPKDGWELREDAEEGSTPTSSMAVADTALDFAIPGHRPFRVLENTSESDDDIVFQGFTWNDDTGRGDPGSTEFEPIARAISLQVNDANAIWQRPVMIGADCNRPDETDVQRVQWLLGTNEYAIFDDVTTYVHTGSPKNMDANDYRGQSGDQVMRDCSEQSGKNWWAKYIGGGDGRLLRVWYGRDSNSTYDSDLFLTNDAVDFLNEDELADGTSLTWPMQDIKVDRDYSRIYCAIYAQFDGGAVRRHNSTTHSAYFGDPGPDSHRTLVVPMSNVHKATTAANRADRMLDDIGDPDIHIACTVRVPAAKATMIRSGMRIPVKLTHEPEFTTWTWCRIVNCTPRPVAAGTEYDLALELTPTGDAGDAEPGPPEPPFTGSAFAGAQGADGNLGTLVWDYVGDSPAPGFNVNPTIAPTSAILAGGTYVALTTSRDITVRVSAAAGFAAVFSAGGHCTITCTSSVNGVIGTGSLTSVGGGFLSGRATIEVTPYDMVAGEILTFTGSYSGVLAGGGWGQAGDNNTYIRVGRGTQYWGSGGSAEVWIGPS